MPMYLTLRRLQALSLLCLLLTACASSGNRITSGTATPTTTRTLPTPAATFTPAPFPTDTSRNDTCPSSLASLVSCQTPQSMRTAYGLTPLIEKGFTGKGQTVVDIVSFGSPTLQQDIDAFDTQFGLPPITIQQISPLNEHAPTGPNNWADETTLDVETIHALAPGANIVVLISDVDQTERGITGLPEFRQLLQYTIDHKLGNIVSQSWGASDIALKDAAGQAEIQKWDTLYKQATTRDGLTIFAASGDNGATAHDATGQSVSRTVTTNFPADDPWVTGVGGTTLKRHGTTFAEVAWNPSGGGFSSLFPAPAYQKALPASVQTLSQNRRGVPDVSGNADQTTGLALYENGSWRTDAGTSASAPMWAALGAIADQMAGHPLGFLNTALYQIAGSARYTQDFHDITIGNNSVLAGGVKVKGYNAVPGWDAVTGLGSPNAVNLLPDVITALNNQG
ncbi:S53 family peptidase [Ktedonobacteria bacterium brp13]|nr:S53 family peptidase [Ktedonobacteria bacterium brp13]